MRRYCHVLAVVFVAGLSLAVVALAQEKVEIEDLGFWEKWSVGAGYSLGICHTGKKLTSSSWGSPSLPLYRLNSLSTEIKYAINSDYAISSNSAYLWCRLGSRRSNLWEPTEPDGSYTYYSNLGWDISVYMLALVVTIPSEESESRPVELGLEYYLGRLLDEAKASRYNETTDAWDDPNYVTVTSTCRGWGMRCALPFEKQVSGDISLVFRIEGRYGISKEVSNNVEEPLIWREPMDIVLSGVFFEISILYKK